jgi:hypothetical protein
VRCRALPCGALQALALYSATWHSRVSKVPKAGLANQRRLRPKIKSEKSQVRVGHSRDRTT